MSGIDFEPGSRSGAAGFPEKAGLQDRQGDLSRILGASKDLAKVAVNRRVIVDHENALGNAGFH